MNKLLKIISYKNIGFDKMMGNNINKVNSNFEMVDVKILPGIIIDADNEVISCEIFLDKFLTKKVKLQKKMCNFDISNKQIIIGYLVFKNKYTLNIINDENYWKMIINKLHE